MLLLGTLLPAGLAAAVPGPAANPAAAGKTSKLPVTAASFTATFRNPNRSPVPNTPAGKLLGGQRYVGGFIPKYESDFKEMGDLGLDGLRFYVGFDQLQDPDGTVNFSRAGWKDIDDVIRWAGKYGITVILDLHNYEGINGPLFRDAGLQDRFVTLWRAIAKRYKNVPKEILAAYEILNEPRPREDEGQKSSPEAGAQWNALVQKVVPVIRDEVGDKRPLIIDAANYANTDMLPYLKNLPAIQDAIFAFHWYHPAPFVRQNDTVDKFHTCVGPQYNNLPYPNPGRPYDGCAGEDTGVWDINRQRAEMDTRVLNVFPAGTPLFNSEWDYGFYNKPPFEDAIRLTSDIRTVCEEKGIAWSWHQWGQSYAKADDTDANTYLRFEGGISIPKAQALGLKT